MEIPGDLEDIEVLSRRRDFLEYLDSDPAEKPEMVADLDHSRSTVDRAIRTLADAGFVERVSEGYRTTLTGCLALERYEAFLDESQSILRAQPILDAVPASLDVPLSAVTNGRAEEVEGEYRAVEILVAELDGADRYRAVLPRMSDSRHVRVLHTQITQHDLDALVVTEEGVYRQIKREFPHLVSELADTDAFSAFAATDLDVGVVLVAEGDRTTAVIVGYDGRDVVGLLRTSDEAAVTWATEFVHRRIEDATETDALEAGDGSPVLELADQRLPTLLGSQGFDLIDDAYFENRAAVDPATAWRSGVKLPEVAAGYTVERYSDDRVSLTSTLESTLEAGDDVALIGPPGSGKSTVCKQVAYEWHDSGRGPVLYRESGQGQPFESADSLEGVLDGVDGHTLVVVEDAVRPEASAVFDAMQSVSGRDDVSVLLDSREQEWHDPEELPTDAWSEAFRHDHVDTVSMPGLDDAEQRDILDRYQEVVESERVTTTDVLDVDDGATGAGEVFLLFHRLARYADPIGEEETATSLQEHVDSVRASLSEAGEAVLDVGVLANGLNAAGIAVTPVTLHAAAVDTDIDHDAVRTAINVLQGDVLFGGGHGGGFQTVHDVWSVEFLDRLVEADDDAADRFGRTLTALLSLADHADNRDAVATAVGGSTDELGVVATDPTTWADDIVTQVFEMGERYPRLAALFGSTDASALELPAACSSAVRLSQRIARGHMRNWAGQFERAEPEFRWLVENLPDPRESDRISGAVGRLYARAHLGLARYHWGDDREAAREHGEAALACFQAVEDDRGIIRTRLELQVVAEEVGDVETGREHVDRAHERAERLGDERLEAKCLNGYARNAVFDNDYESAVEWAQRAESLARAANSLRVEKSNVQTLSTLHYRLGNLDAAEQKSRRSLQLATRLGDTHEAFMALVNLAQCAQLQGRLDDANQSLARAREEVGAPFGHVKLREEVVQATLDRLDGDTDTARERLESVVDDAAEAGLLQPRALAEIALADVLLDTGEAEAARDRAEAAVETSEEVDEKQLVGCAHRARARTALADGDTETAAERYRAAEETLSAQSLTVWSAKARRGRGDVARERGNEETARDHYEAALASFRESGAARLALEVVEDLTALDESAEWYATGAEIADEAGLPDRADQFRARAEETRQARTD